MPDREYNSSIVIEFLLYSPDKRLDLNQGSTAGYLKAQKEGDFVVCLYPELVLV
jgi:hypothetical protein